MTVITILLLAILVQVRVPITALIVLRSVQLIILKIIVAQKWVQRMTTLVALNVCDPIIGKGHWNYTRTRYIW